MPRRGVDEVNGDRDLSGFSVVEVRTGEFDVDGPERSAAVGFHVTQLRWIGARTGVRGELTMAGCSPMSSEDELSFRPRCAISGVARGARRD
jgi:hypothetical protein